MSKRTMGQLKALADYIEMAELTVPTKSDKYHRLMQDHGCLLNTFLDVYLAEAKNPLKAKFIALSKELRRLGWFSALATNSVMVFGKHKTLVEQRAKQYAKGETDATMGDIRTQRWLQTEYSSTDLLKGHIEMALTSLKATTYEDQVVELKKSGYIVTKRGDDFNIRFNEERLQVTPGDALQLRARMEAYAEIMWPGNTYTHFVIKAGQKSLYYSLGASTKDMRSAVAAAS